MSVGNKVVSNKFVLTVKPKNGDPATVYSLKASANVITKDQNGVPLFDVLTFDIIKRVGMSETTISTVSDFTSAGLSLFYKKGSGSEVEVTISYMSGYGTSVNYHDIEILYDEYDGVITWILRKNGSLLDKVGIGSVKNGTKGGKGDTGRMFYLAGEWTSGVTYTRNEKVCPIVHHGDKYWYLDADVSIGNVPADNSEYWKEAPHFGLVLTDALFAMFSKLGSFIVAGDFFISQYGTLIAQGSERIIDRQRVDMTHYYRNGIQSNAAGSVGMPAYMFFDVNDPMGEDVVGNTNSYTIEGDDDDAGIVKCIHFYASSSTSLRVTVNPSSEADFDFGAVGLLDSYTLSADDVDASTIRNGDTATLVKASGTTPQTATLDISQGHHFLEIGYFKDEIDSGNLDCATFIFEEVGNSYIGGFSQMKFRPMRVVNALTGEEWIAGGKLHVDRNGDMVMRNIAVNDAVMRNIAVNDAIIQGSLMFHKVVHEASSNGLALANSTTDIHTTMKADIFIVSRNYSIFHISFPPAYLFPGAGVKIVITKAITYEMTITRLDREEAEYEDNWGEVYNGFVNILDSDRGVSSLQFHQSDYRMIELVSVRHPVHTSYYAWMLINAQ